MIAAVSDEQIERLDLVTSDEVQRMTGWHRGTVLKYARNGKLPATRLTGGRGIYVFRRAAVVEAMAALGEEGAATRPVGDQP